MIDPLTTEQSIQEEQYELPYHYIPQVKGQKNFSQTISWSWGARYLGGLERVIKSLAALQWQSLIDIGCGDGRFLSEVSSRWPSREFVGIDYSGRAVDLANALNPNLVYVREDIFEDNSTASYDVATLVEVLEHIPPQDLGRFLTGVHNRLNPGGKLLITVPHQNKKLNPKHYQHFTADSLRQTLKSHFDVETIIPFDRLSRKISLLTHILGYSGANYVITNKTLNRWYYELVLRGCLEEQHEDKAGRLLAVASSKTYG